MNTNIEEAFEDELLFDVREKIPANPLGNIALSMSGGGYRAASFHLGAMSFLNKISYEGKPVLERVKLISTVSGGTITGAVYALMKQDGKTFKEIFYFIMDKLHRVDLLKDGLAKLNPDSALRNSHKTKNLINAFAELYDAHFTNGATFQSFDTMRSHLETVVFNSTEFSNAINFRFRNKSRSYFGNEYIRVKSQVASEVKISDAIASSSCFPGGFEPMRWPHDFVHDDAPNLKALCEATPLSIGIMDGGIYDNQGTQSILMYKKGQESPYFDLVIISDVASPYMDPYKPFAERSKEGLRKLALDQVLKKYRSVSVTMGVSLFVLTLFLLAVPVIWNYDQSFSTGVFVGLSAVPASLLLLKFFLVSKIKSLADSLLTRVTKLIPQFYIDKLKALKVLKLSAHRFEPLVMDRVNSLLTLLADVFLKVVRRLNYNALYEDHRYTYRRISNLVQELTRYDFESKRARAKSPGKPRNPDSPLNGGYETVVGSNISAVVEDAAGFGTTLWFTDYDQLHRMLDKLVATGQITMCYNMIEYLEKLIFETSNGFDELSASEQQSLKSLYWVCVEHWKEFKNDPMCMIKI